MVPKGAPGGSWALLQLGKNGRNFPQPKGAAAEPRAGLQCKFPRCTLAFQPAIRWHIPPTRLEPAAFHSPAFAGGCAGTEFLLFPQQELRTIWISKAAALIGSCSLQWGRRGLLPGRHPQLCPPVLPVVMLESHIPAGPWGLSAHSWAREHPRGGPRVGWVEGKGEEDVNLEKRSGML